MAGSDAGGAGKVRLLRCSSEITQQEVQARQEAHEHPSFRKRHTLDARSLEPVQYYALHHHHLGADFLDVASLRPARFKRTGSFLDAAPTPQNLRGLMVRARTRSLLPPAGEELPPERPYVGVAAMSMVLNVLSVVPYVRILAVDPSSPLFIAFCTNVFVVCMHLSQAKRLLLNRRLPLKFHVCFVALSFLFGALKADAFSRIPTALGLVLLNLQMLVGMAVQATIFKQTFSAAQMSGCAVVTFGVALCGIAGRSSKGSGALAQGGQLFMGVVELVGALVAVVLLNALVKLAFSRHGECIDEQIFFQHLFSIPMYFVGNQWQSIGPKFAEWSSSGSGFLVAMLLVNLVLTWAGGHARVAFAGRAPNGLLVQLVETLTKFISVFATAMVNAPPWPPLGFWCGSGVLVLGTLQFLTASDPQGSGVDEDSPRDESKTQ